MRTKDMDLPIIIVEFGQQRQRLKLNKFDFNLNELVELFSRIFQKTFNLEKYEILLFNQRLDSMTNLDFTQLDNYSRFKIQFNNKQTSSYSSADEMISLKQRLKTASMEIMEMTFLINSIHTDCKNLIKTFTDEDKNQDLIVPPGFKPLSNSCSTSSPRDSQSSDEGIDRDTGSVSIFESAHSDYQSESIYVECREDVTIINEPNRINNNTQLEWRNQPYRPRPHWNSNKVKHQGKKTINPNKAPLPAEKKKNIPCKYAAGGNCKRGSQCRFIHVV